MGLDISEHRLKSIKQDIESLKRTNKSSLEIGVSMTTSMIKIIIDQIKVVNQTASEPEILEKVRKSIYLKRLKECSRIP